MLADELLRIMQNSDANSSVYLSYLDFSDSLVDSADNTAWNHVGSYSIASEVLNMTFPNHPSMSATNYISRSVALPNKYEVEMLFQYQHPVEGTGWVPPVLFIGTGGNISLKVANNTLYFNSGNAGSHTVTPNTNIKVRVVVDDVEPMKWYVNDVLASTSGSPFHNTTTNVSIGDSGWSEWVGGTIKVDYFKITEI